MVRKITYSGAILEAQKQLLESDPRVYILGLGVPTPSGVFGTTVGLQEQFGSARVIDIPAAENGITGVALGSAIAGMRPIMIHQRVDFSILSLEPIVNQAAKWHYMYGGNGIAPLTIRMIIGRGWGQGPQHSQSLQAWFAHVPGLQVLMPTNPSDAKGMLIAAVNSDAPSIILEHRWLYDIEGDVNEQMYETALGVAEVRRLGSDISLIGVSYMTIECLEAARVLGDLGISAEVVDLKSISPLDIETVLMSVRKTKRLIVADTGHTHFGISAEIIARVAETTGISLLAKPERIGLPNSPTPTAYSLAEGYYPTSHDIVISALKLMGVQEIDFPLRVTKSFTDIPNSNFTGPY